MRATVDRPGLDSQGRSSLIKIRRVRKGDLSKVRDVIEQAFGDFFERQVGTRPRQVFGGAQYVHHRWLMEPWGCFVAEEGDGKIVGAAVAVMWGTLGLVGPIAVLTSEVTAETNRAEASRTGTMPTSVRARAWSDLDCWDSVRSAC